MSSDKDIVEKARGLAPYVQGVADSTGGGKLSAVPALLRDLADEVERLRAKLNDPCLVAGYHVCGGAHNLSDLTKE